MPEQRDLSLDLVGAGKLAQAIPARAWDRLVTTACETFTQCLAPITATTSGAGRLIQARFDRLVDAQKVLAAETLSRASRKAANRRTGTPRAPKTSVIIAAIEASSVETDETVRELWANLLAHEFIHAGVHPEFPRILSRMSSSDARTLAKIASEGKRRLSRVKLNIFLKSLVHVGLVGVTEGTNFSLEHLAGLNVIHREEGIWNLTEIGRAFIDTVSNPELGGEE